MAKSRALSKQLFNAQHRLAVGAVFLASPEQIFGYEEIAEAVGVSRSVAHKELSVLVRIGAVDRLQLGRAVGYRRAESSFWPWVEELLGRP